MGSEKKRKRRESEAAADETPDRPDKAERKRLKRQAKEAAKEATPNGSAVKSSQQVIDETPQVPALVSPIATPMAGRKLTKKLYKLIGHAAKNKAICRGIKEVVLAIRKGDRGVVVMAGDVFPIDVIAHLPVLCEEANIPYCFVSRKTELGAAGLTKRPTSVVMVSEKRSDGDVKKELADLKEEVRAIQNLF